MKRKFILLIVVFIASLSAQSATIMATTNDHFKDMLNSIVLMDFPEKDYYQEVTDKTQVCLHHTASGKGIEGDYRQFLKPGHIATAIIVGHDSVHQLFSSRYWGYHLGIKKSVFYKRGLRYRNLNKSTIGVEIDNWGALRLINGEFRAWPNEYGTGSKKDRSGSQLKVVVPEHEVVYYPKSFRGHKYYQRYNQYQIDFTEFLLMYWHDYYGIPLHYNSDMWDVSTKALKGTPGIYGHISYRSDKSDCHPQPELIRMLKNIEAKYARIV